MVGSMPSLRRRVHDALERSEEGKGLSRWVDLGIATLIALNVLAVILETVGPLQARFGPWFVAFDVFSVLVFTVEYVARLWSCVEDPRYADGWRGRLRYARTPMAIIDLLAILPFWFSYFTDADLRFLRALRLLRLFKLTRYSASMAMLGDVMREEAGTLLAGFSVLFILLILAASGAYIVEHRVQPEVFGSIPQAMWWALVTLTTVGYGDVTPVTMAGRVFGGIVMVVGIGMAALPAGILASGLTSQLEQRRHDMREKFRIALRDGMALDHEDTEKIESLRRSLGLSADVARRIHEQVAREAETDSQCTCPRCGMSFTPDP